MRFEIRPNVGVGNILYGMTKVQVEKMLNLPHKTFRRGSESVESEYYISIGLLAYYDDHGRLEAVEFARPAEPFLGGLDLLALDLFEARALFRASSGPVRDSVDGSTSKALGLGVWAPNAKDDPRAALESVIAFGPGYYEQYT